MLHNASSFHGFSLHATDGDIGHIEDFYFDDESWRVRYVVVNTGNWLSSRRVLISPVAFDHNDCGQRKLSVILRQGQIQNSPSADLHQPISRRWEQEYHNYYDWPIYWVLAPLGGIAAYPSVLNAAEEEGEAQEAAQEQALDVNPDEIADDEDSHLQSMNDVCGYTIETPDGNLGHIEDFILSDDWAVRYIVVDTGRWWTGKKVLLRPEAITDVRWPERTVQVRWPREVISNAPEFSGPVSLEYASALDEYYAQHTSSESSTSHFQT
jgi:hypothetical protein